MKLFHCKVSSSDMIHKSIFYFSVPTPMLSIELSIQNNFFAGSELTITCNIIVDYTVDTPFIVNTTWTMTNGSVHDILTNTTKRITVLSPFETSFNTYSTQVIFSTFSTSMDSGMYTCNVSIDGDYDSLLNSDEISKTVAIIGKFHDFNIIS